jgi:hypothetical protein
MSKDEDGDDYEVGYKKPPKHSMFKKGDKGNPGGRPPGSHVEPPYEAVLGQTVTIREDGEERRVTAAEAFLLHMTKQGLEKGGATARTTMAGIEEARIYRDIAHDNGPTIFVIRYVRPGTANCAMEALRMAKKLDRYRDTARTVLEPWIVGAALARFGDKQLNRDEQKTVERATRTPHRVNWPNWWTIRYQR